MLRITRDGFTIEADTQAELQMAIAALRSTQNDVPALPVIPEADVFGQVVREDKYPDERYIPEHLVIEPYLSAVPSTHALTHAAKLVPVVDSTVSPAVQMVPVGRKLLDILEIVLCFPDGISSKGVQHLTGLSDGAVGNRLTRLRVAGLLERIPHSITWRATDLARRSKLVAS